ncbi:MAG: NADH-quinone oxidoreductase subunit J [Ornithinimicrobium sp.]
MTLRDGAFLAIGLLACASAVLAVTSRQVLHAALWLVVTLGAVAGCYLVLGAELVALVQLLVYVGGVVVVLLFALMLTRSAGGNVAPVDASRPRRLLGAAVAAGITLLLGGSMVALVGWQGRPVDGPGNAVIGAQIFDTWVWPFELLSLLLLLALVGAIAVSRGAGVTEDARTRAGGAHRPPEEVDA